MYDGGDVVLIFDNSGAWQHRYLHGAVVDQVFMEESIGEILWGLADNQGTIRDVANYDPIEDESAVLNHREFNSFGRITAESNSSINFLLAYTGRYFDEDTRIQLNGERWYDAQVGRWISEDPIGFAGGDVNISGYVGNSPTNFVDPSGLVPQEYSPASFGLFGDGASWLFTHPQQYAAYLRVLMSYYNHQMLVRSNGASAADGPSTPINDDWIGGGLAHGVRLVIPDEQLARPGGLGSDILIAARVATEITGLIDPTPFSDLLNASLQLADGDRAGAGVTFAGAAIPGGADKVFKHLDDVPVDKLLKAGAKSADELATVGRGGRRGNQATRQHLDEVRDQFLDANPDFRHVRGGRNRATGAELPEEYIPPLHGGRRGGSYADLTFEARDGSRFRINTTDARVNGTMTPREQTNFDRIFDQTGEPIMSIPKPLGTR